MYLLGIKCIKIILIISKVAIGQIISYNSYYFKWIVFEFFKRFQNVLCNDKMY